MSKQELKQKGFTIIEVVLVLAIAALIFLMVFIALPALQRNQRDTARKQELGKVISAVTTYQSNNKGKSPTDSAADLTAFAKYVDGTVNGSAIDLTTTSVTINTSATNGTTGGATKDVIILAPGKSCADDNTFAAPKSSRQAAAIVVMENADANYCQAS